MDNELKRYKLYIHINKVNQKCYIGITSKKNPAHRWNSNGSGYKENKYFYNAILKYGWDNFEHIIIKDDLLEDEAKAKEKIFIALFKSNDRNFGYNMTQGGDGTLGCHPSEETRLKQSIARRRENLSEETRRMRSESLKNRRLTDEHKKKIGESNSKRVCMMSLDGIVIQVFNSLTEAEAQTGISHSHISQCCNLQRKTSGGYLWEYA